MAIPSVPGVYLNNVYTWESIFLLVLEVRSVRAECGWVWSVSPEGSSQRIHFSRSLGDSSLMDQDPTISLCLDWMTALRLGGKEGHMTMVNGWVCFLGTLASVGYRSLNSWRQLLGQSHESLMSMCLILMQNWMVSPPAGSLPV